MILVLERFEIFVRKSYASFAPKRDICRPWIPHCVVPCPSVTVSCARAIYIIMQLVFICDEK